MFPRLLVATLAALGIAPMLLPADRPTAAPYTAGRSVVVLTSRAD